MVIAFVRKVTIDTERYAISQYRNDDQDSMAFGPAVTFFTFLTPSYT